MTYKQQFTELLCTVGSIKRQIQINEEALDGISKDYPDWGDYNIDMCVYSIEYHHLMMYCKEKSIELIIQANGVIKILDNSKGKGISVYKVIANIDITKPLSEQTEEVYKQLFTNLR